LMTGVGVNELSIVTVGNNDIITYSNNRQFICIYISHQ
jgi:hypothetical protein